MSDASLASFVDKWRGRWPEWSVLAVFTPAAQQPLLGAWFSLLQELRDAAWAGSDPTPGLAKLAWWQEELVGWGRGARRHPLGEALQRQPAPWDGLGRALAGLPSTRAGAAGEAEAGALARYAEAVLACEQALFGGPAPDPAGVAATVAALRAERALTQGDREAASALQARPGRPLHGASRPRRLHHAILAQRLRLLAKDAGPTARTAPLRLLYAAWRAARAA